MGFVVVATIFWFMMAMNDSIQKDCTVRLQIDNVPDSVTFITQPPATMHVTVRDQGTKLMRTAAFRTPTIHINFKDHSDGVLFRFSSSDMKAGLKGLFGKSSTLLSVSLDSIRLDYSTGKGKQVPVVVVAAIEPAPGIVLTGKPQSLPAHVTLHGPREILDTISRVFTTRLSVSGIKEDSEFRVGLKPISRVRMIPDQVGVKVGAEPLVRREEYVDIKPIHVPEGINLVLFPSKVAVEFYVPMSRFGAESPAMEATVDYSQVAAARNGKLAVTLYVSRGAVSPSLKMDSVEYSIVR